MSCPRRAPSGLVRVATVRGLVMGVAPTIASALAVESGWLLACDFVAQALAGGSVVGVVTSRLYWSVAAVMPRVSGFASGWRSCLASAC